MWADLKVAAREGVILGVKYGLAAIIVLFMVAALLGDYAIVRQRALNGQKVYEEVEELKQRQRSQQMTPPVVAPPEKK